MKKKETQLTGVKEIARRGNVSIGTVDRVIHNRQGVSAKTRDKVKMIIKDMDYRPNLLGRMLASRKTTSFATLIPAVSKETSFWEGPLRGIERAESEISQYNVKIEKCFFDQNNKGSFIKEANKILKKKPDGILLAPNFIEESINFTDKCRKLNIPFVFMDSDIPGQQSLSYIGPHLYESGYLAANLISYLIGEKDRILIVHISAEIENHHHLLRKEEGFKNHFNDHRISNSIEKIDIKKVSFTSVKKQMNQILEKYNDIKVIYVTNSKVSLVAQYLKESGKNILLVGYDLIKENIPYLEEEIINFLICQKPAEQAHKGIMTLYKHIVLKLPVDDNVFMPKDIVMKTNYANYIY